MRHGETVFVATGALIALALTRDPFLEGNAHRDVALLWKDSLEKRRRLKVLECRRKDRVGPSVPPLLTQNVKWARSASSF